jgi:hypothetical protein
MRLEFVEHRGDATGATNFVLLAVSAAGQSAESPRAWAEGQ